MEHDPYRCAVLSLAGDDTGKLVIEALVAAGHRVVDREVCDDTVGEIYPRLERWIADPAVDLVVVTGGDELAADDPTLDALAPLATRRLPGFGEAVRAIALNKLGVPALLSRAAAAVCGHTIVIALPGSPQLVVAALDALVVPQLAAPGASLGAVIAHAPRPRDEHRTKPPPLPPRRTTVSPAVLPVAPPPPRPAAITTGSIATIGDLPTFTYDAASDLRRGGRRTSPWLALLAIVAMCASVAAAVVVVLHGQPAPSNVPVPVPAPASAPVPVPAPVPVLAAVPVPAAVPAVPAPVAVVAVPAHHVAPVRPAEPTPDAAPIVDTGCDEVSCVLSHYERECCAPYKPAAAPPPKPAGPPESLDRSMVQTGMSEVKPLISQCGDHSGIKGTVKLHVDVAASGAVTAVDVRESPDPALGACVAAAARKTHFAATQSGGSFTYPYVF